MGLIFNRGDSEDGCGQHHFPDKSEYSENWRKASFVGAGPSTVDFIVPREATCLHDGCSVTDSEHGVRRTVSKELLVIGSQNAPRQADNLREYADRIDPEVDDDDV